MILKLNEMKVRACTFVFDPDPLIILNILLSLALKWLFFSIDLA